MGAQIGKGPGNAGIYDPREKGKKSYWKAVQADLEKQSQKKNGKVTKKIGR